MNAGDATARNPKFARKPALYYELIPNGGADSPAGSGSFARCVLCPRKCALPPEGGTGACGARRNDDGVVYSINYGRISSIALDPIEKKPLKMFKPGSKILSIGSFGCNLYCPFCQNYALLDRPAADGFYMTPESLARLALDARADGNIGAAYTYNEPLISYEFVLEAARAVADAGLCNVLVTNGYVEPSPLSELLPLVSALNIDLKGDDAFYRELCGAADRSPVLRSIRMAREAGRHVEVTCLLVSGRNDSERAVIDIASAVAEISDDIPLHLSRFSPEYKMRGVKPTDIDFMYAAADIARRYLRHIFLGNIVNF